MISSTFLNLFTIDLSSAPCSDRGDRDVVVAEETLEGRMQCLQCAGEKAVDIFLEVFVRQVSYIINFKGNVNELNELLRDLESQRKTVGHQVVDAENNLRGINENVDGWLKKVDKKIVEVVEFQTDEAHTKTGCSRGLLPFLWYRHRLGRKAKKMAAEVKSLIDAYKFDGVSHPLTPASMEATSSNAGYDEFDSRRDLIEKIMAKLKDSSVRMIGIHGAGGVGKSTLVNAIAKRARGEQLFNVVVTVDITANPNPLNIQKDIAYELGLRFEGEGERGRADRLRKRLKQEKANTLIILDNLWNGLDLNKLGIPLDDDDDLSHVIVKHEKDSESKEEKGEKGFKFKEEKVEKDFESEETCQKDFGYKLVKMEKPRSDYKGCKILLTSRFKEVLCDKMNVVGDSFFSMKELDDKEAVMLFKKVAKIQEGHSKFKPEIVKCCAGLPMAIVTIGKALRDKSEAVWEDALEKLNKQELLGVQKYMEFSIKMSYDHLESKELKSIFLLCARIGHQPLIMDLVKYCFGLGILKGVHTLRDARDKVSALVQKLKDSGLVLDGNSSDHFINMHDMVREAALSIAREEQKIFALRNDKLDDWPDKDELEKCTAISIHNSNIIDELPKVINCPQLKVLHIDNDDPYLKIPESFFEGMEKLRVLILTGFHLPCLPSSLKCLLNLRMLCLERCVLCGDLSIIGELNKLRILSFSGSQIETFSAKLGCFSKLHLLDISDCSIEKVISFDFISRLTSLEELYMRSCLIKKDAEEEANRSLITILAALRHFHQLTFLDICIPSAAILPRSLFFNKLNDYKIVVGDFKIVSIADFKMPNKYEASRSLALQLKDGTDVHYQKGLKMLFKTVENLLLGEINGVQNAFYELNLNGFPKLKHLSITDNHDMECIINSMELSHPQDVFPNLESLSLNKLRNIKMICCSAVTNASFNKLKIIKVKMCSQLKNLFSFDLVKFLTSLETIDVSECDYLKEIVVDERQVNTGMVRFRNLRSLTLQVLPLFTSFYTNDKMLSVPSTDSDHLEITIADDEHSDMASFSLFGKLVDIPNIESLNLSSINIQKIWNDQPLSSFCFENLIKLIVKDCHNLTYLCSLSVASCLKKLKGLFVSECPKMEKIFITEGNSMDNSKVCIFPKLEEIQLTDMKMLTDIWQTKVGPDSFSSLVSVHIVSCRKLDKVFPSHMAGRLGSLDSLKVVDCKSVEVIFELEDSPQIAPPGIDTKLQLLHLDELPKLKQVWNRDPGGILNFKNLRSIQVSSCDKLRTVLPASVAKDLKKLEDFAVAYCCEIEEIVAWEEGSLVFPEVTNMEFAGLPKIKWFYRGRHIIKCPKLKRLAVRGCARLKTFTTEATNEEGKPVFLAKEVISKLEYIEIDSKGANWLQRNVGGYQMHHLKELCLWSLPNIKILYWFLNRIPNLEKLELSGTAFGIEELVPRGNIAPQERLGTVLQLKELVMISSWIMDIGFERDPVLQTVERLVISWCYELINLAHFSVSFTHLTYLKVENCPELIYLMASSTAKSLVQLTTMKVTDCGAMKEIVNDVGNEENKLVDIEFSKLITLELVKLKNVTSFCSHENCEFKFPLLEKLIVRDCPRIKTFTESHIKAPKLQNILAVEGEEEEKWYWEGDLNATIQKASTDKVTFESIQHLELSDYYPELKQLWYGDDLVQEYSFRNLKTLVVKDCKNLVHVIPSHLLPCFKNLEELEVKSCRAVQVIFNIDDRNVAEALGIFRLKKLYLSELPKLEHVWDEDPEGILGLQALRHMHAEECDSLITLFRASMAKYLARLKKLRVANCKDLVEIFEKDEKAAEGETKELVFHCLTSLELSELPRLKYFYPGLHTLEWPVLKELKAYACNLVTLKCQEAHPEKQVLIPIEQVIQIPSFEELSFGIEVIKFAWDRVSRKIEFKDFKGFQEESDSVLYPFLQMVLNIQKLEVGSSPSLKKMFSAKRPNADYTGVLSHLEELKLYFLDDLESIGLEHSWLRPFPEKLQILKVEYCRSLVNLVPCKCEVSFSNLTDLVVNDCYRMLYLFTSSTAKSLARLKRMNISWCTSMEEIVSKEADESSQDLTITFEQLQALCLENLPKLRCFYPGNFTLGFPSLEEVSVINCDSMKTFCPVSIINPTKLSFVVRFTKDETPQWRWDGDLNTTMRKTYEEMIAMCKDLSLEDHPELQEIWHGSVPVPDLSFKNLESLIIDGCKFLSAVLLPIHLLPFLTNLERMEVRNCGSVKTIFDVKCIRKDREMITIRPAILPLHFSLKKLKLKHLQNLENVWNGDPDGILRVQLLQEVSVDTCKRLTSLFPATVAKDFVKLENLVVKNCENLTAIVAEGEATPKGTNLEFTFPCVTSLTLLDLPKFEVCIGKVTPNLQYLLVGEKELRMVWHEQFQGNLFLQIKDLVLDRFNTESDELPYGFLQKVPNIERLVVSNSSFMEIFGSERPNVDYIGFLSQLKGLKLDCLSKLISIGFEHSWVEETFLKNLETLEATSCYRLRNLVASPVCFCNLMYLTVAWCSELMYVFTSSTAKKLARLREMDISNCKSVQEIVSTEGDESQSHQDEIKFEQLQVLKVERLPNLKSFYKGSFTLSFPSLEQLSILYCHTMETFSSSAINAKKLLGVKLDVYADAVPLEVDLNSTIQQKFQATASEIAQSVKHLELEDKPELHAIWRGSSTVPFRRFNNLESLVVERCEFLTNVIPSHILPLLCNLEKLVVRHCDSVKAIFEVKGITKDTEKLSFRLNNLTLEWLPNLKHVWDSDPQGVIGFQVLREVDVKDCNSLESVFPASAAESLGNLEKLDIQDCKGLAEIVAKDEAVAEGTCKEFVLTRMTSITLMSLPELKCFYPGLHKLECPILKEVHLYKCDKLKTFTSESQGFREAQSESPVGNPFDWQALFMAEKVIPNLEFLALNKEDTMTICDGKFDADLLHKLKVLYLQGFCSSSDIFPHELLHKVPNIEKLRVQYSSFKEIFCSERPSLIDSAESLSHPKYLTLYNLSELNSIGLEHF